jgi:hypothetical protein
VIEASPNPSKLPANFPDLPILPGDRLSEKRKKRTASDLARDEAQRFTSNLPTTRRRKGSEKK